MYFLLETNLIHFMVKDLKGFEFVKLYRIQVSLKIDFLKDLVVINLLRQESNHFRLQIICTCL